jgi:biotin carboxylase
MSKKLLVLAASLYQLETILSAKRLGYQVITVDNRAANPGHALADKSYNVSTVDMRAVLEISRKEAIDGVIAPCTDVAVPTAAYVAQELNLRGVPLQAANIVCDKIFFREFLKEHDFPVPENIPLDSSFAAADRLFEKGPWIIKPDRSSGSKGVFIVESAAEFAHRLPETLSFSPTGSAILERYVDGFQGTCEGVLRNGELALTCILDRQTADAPYVTTCGHYVPTKLEPRLQEALLGCLNRLWKLLRVSEGPFDCDFVATRDEVYLLEISPRIGGNAISTLLLKAFNFDLVRYSIQLALGEDPPWPTSGTIRPAAVVILGVPQSGRLAYDEEALLSLRREQWVDSLEMDYECDAPVSAFINSRHRIGQAIIFGESRADLENRVLELKRRLHIRTI